MIKIWKDISMLWKNEVNIFSTLGQHLVNNWSTYQWLTFGAGTMKNVQKMTKKIDFLKSMQWLPPMSWVIRDRIGGLVLPLKTFYDHFRIRWRNRKNRSKNLPFWPWIAPKAKKINFMTVLADAFDVVQIDWDVVKYFPARFWKVWSLYFWVPKKYWS